MASLRAGTHSANDVGEINLTDEAVAPGAWSVLGRVAVTLASTLELREVLRRLARIGHEVSGAAHCSVFLLEGRALVPTVAVGDRPDEPTFRAFRSMNAIPLGASRWALLTSGRPIALEDASTSDVVPPRWRRRFQPGGLVLVPLTAEGVPCGLMAVGWNVPRRFTADELAALGAIGAAAGVAVRNARLYEELQRRSRLHEALVDSGAALAAPVAPSVIAELLADAYAGLIGARACAIAFLDTERSCIKTIAVHGFEAPGGPLLIDEIPGHLVKRVWGSWEQAKTPIEFANEPWIHDHLGGRYTGSGWYLLSPIVVEGHTRGLVLLGFEPGRRLDPEERDAIRALAGIAGAAVERAMHEERRDRRLRQLDALYRVSAALTEGADAPAMVGELNALLRDHGIEVVGIAFRDERLATRLGADRMTRRERTAMRTGDWNAIGDDVAAVPMRLGRRVFGVMRVRPPGLDPEERAFLETLARGLAEVARRDDLRASVEAAEREQVLAADRDRMASDLHDTAGQVFVAMGLLVKTYIEEWEGDEASRRVLERVAELADRGKWEIDQAARALAFVPAARRGLVVSLEELAEDVGGDSGMEITVSTAGPVRRAAMPVERALYRVAHEAVANAWRHAGCSLIAIRVDFTDETVTLTVSDDGKGFHDGAAEGTGISGMRRAVEECGGTLVIRSRELAGTEVVATASRRR